MRRSFRPSVEEEEEEEEAAAAAPFESSRPLTVFDRCKECEEADSGLAEVVAWVMAFENRIT